jgi:hypothetical protein
LGKLGITFSERTVSRLFPPGRRPSQTYLRSWAHLALNKDAPVSRPIASPAEGGIVAIPQPWGPRHRYERRVGQTPTRWRQTELPSQLANFGNGVNAVDSTRPASSHQL